MRGEADWLTTLRRKRQAGILQNLESGDSLTEDKGFGIEDLLAARDVKLNNPRQKKDQHGGLQRCAPRVEREIACAKNSFSSFENTEQCISFVDV